MQNYYSKDAVFVYGSRSCRSIASEARCSIRPQFQCWRSRQGWRVREWPTKICSQHKYSYIHVCISRQNALPVHLFWSKCSLNSDAKHNQSTNFENLTKSLSDVSETVGSFQYTGSDAEGSVSPQIHKNIIQVLISAEPMDSEAKRQFQFMDSAVADCIHRWFKMQKIPYQPSAYLVKDRISHSTHCETKHITSPWILVQ